MALKLSRLVAGGFAAGLALGASQPVLAQETARSEAGDLSEVIITATRRATNVQDTPLSVTAIGGDSLREQGITDPRDLSALAPSLQVDQGLAAGQTHVSIRGVASTDFGIGSNSPIATNIDDVYQPFQFGIATQVFDMNRIEVLRGPQGTLFGKNTTSGALNYYSQTPTHDLGGYALADASGGDATRYSVEGAYNVPLSDQFAMRLSLRADHRDDYVDNLFDGSELGNFTTYSGRLQFAWTPSDATTVNFKLFGVDHSGDGPIYSAQYLDDPCSRGGFPAVYLCATGTPAPESPNSRSVYSDVPTFENFNSYGATLKVDHELGGGFTLTSITAYQEGEIEFANNDDGTAGDAFHSLQQSETSQYSQEFRIATPEDLRLRAVFGVFAQHDEILTDQGSASTQIDTGTTFPVDNFGYDYYGGSLATQEGDSYAVFASTTYDVTDAFSLVAGLRYSQEEKDVVVDFLSRNGSGPPPTFPFHNPPLNLLVEDISYRTIVARGYPFDPATDEVEHSEDNHTWSKLTWDLTANFKPSDDSLLFARVATGFRSGGYPIGVTRTGVFERLEPEEVMSYELGFKTEWFDNTVRFNGAVFAMQYDDMQVQITSSTGTGSRLTNAASATVNGMEFELEWAPIDGANLFGSIGYTDATFEEYDTNDPTRGDNGFVNGNRLPYAPEVSANFGGDYEFDVGNGHSVILGANWTYRSEIYFDPYEDPNSTDDAHLIGNLRASYGSTDDGWRLTAYVRNVTDEENKVFAFPFGRQPNVDPALSLDALIAPTIYGPLRTYGVQLSVDF